MWIKRFGIIKIMVNLYQKSLGIFLLVAIAAVVLPVQTLAQGSAPPPLPGPGGIEGPGIVKLFLNDVEREVGAALQRGDIDRAKAWRAWEKAAKEFLAKTPCSAPFVGLTSSFENFKRELLEAVRSGDVNKLKRLNLFEFLEGFKYTDAAEEAKMLKEEVTGIINDLLSSEGGDKQTAKTINELAKLAEERSAARISQEKLATQEISRISQLTPEELAAEQVESRKIAERLVAEMAAKEKLARESAAFAEQLAGREAGAVGVGSSGATQTGVGLGARPAASGLATEATQTGVLVTEKAAQKTGVGTAAALAEQAVVKRGAAKIIIGGLTRAGLAVLPPALAAYGAGDLTAELIGAVSEGIEGVEDAARQVLGEVAKANDEINREVPRYQEAIAKTESELDSLGSRYQDAQNALDIANSNEQAILNDPTASVAAKVAAQAKAGEAERVEAGLKSQIDALDSDLAVFKGALKADQQKQKELQEALNIMQEVLGLPESQLHQVGITIPDSAVRVAVRSRGNNFLVTADPKIPVIFDFAQPQCPPPLGVAFSFDPKTKMASFVGPSFSYATVDGQTYGTGEKIPYNVLSGKDVYINMFLRGEQFINSPDITAGLTYVLPDTMQELFPSIYSGPRVTRPNRQAVVITNYSNQELRGDIRFTDGTNLKNIVLTPGRNVVGSIPRVSGSLSATYTFTNESGQVFKGSVLVRSASVASGARLAPIQKTFPTIFSSQTPKSVITPGVLPTPGLVTPTLFTRPQTLPTPSIGTVVPFKYTPPTFQVPSILSPQYNPPSTIFTQ